MRKLKVLIEGNAPDSVRLVEVVITVPVATLIPALVEAMQLPQTDPFGKQLAYQLSFAKGGQVIPMDMTLADAGVTLGARLILDLFESDDSENDQLDFPAPSALQQFEQGAPGVSVDISNAVTLVDPAQFSDSYSMEETQYPVDLQQGNTSGLYDTMGKRPGIIEKKTRGPSRRTFLLAASAVCGIGGIGLCYAAYHTSLEGRIESLIAKKPATLHPTAVQHVQIQSKPRQPTMARLQFSFTKHQNIVRGVAWSPDGKLLASCSDDKHALLWTASGTVQQDILHPGGVRALAWSPDSQRLVTGANNEVSFFSAQTAARLAHSTHRHTQIVTSLAWTARNEMQVVSGGADKQAIIWDTKTYRSLTRYEQHNAGIDVVSWSADGRTVASSSDNGIVRIWNAADGKDVHGYYQDAEKSMRAMAFASTGTQLAVGGDDGIVRIWNALTCGNNGQRCADEPQRVQASQAPIRTLAWSPNGLLLAVGGNDGTFSIWDLQQKQRALLSIKQNDIVRSLTWSPDGKQLASAYGMRVSIWNLQ